MRSRPASTRSSNCVISRLVASVTLEDGDVEQITDEPDSAQLLEELHLAVLATKQQKRKRQDSKMVATDSRKRKKVA
jgi:hypothetical protein